MFAPLRPTASSQQGFTLVEIAIVLVIVGLLLGSVLKGQEVITQARVKNALNDFNGATAATFSYRDRYGATPGDDGNANPRWQEAKNGGHDGQLSGAYNATPPLEPGSMSVDNHQNESLNFWWHLRLSGFIAGPTQGAGAASQPSNVVGGILGVQTGAIGLNGNVICSSNIPDKIAVAIDTQLDDQRPNSGTVRAHSQAGTSSPATGAASQHYIENGSSQYLLCRSL
jgi:prepilin-type N-terminal cleavage/methylation domain-containing protein